MKKFISYALFCALLLSTVCYSRFSYASTISFRKVSDTPKEPERDTSGIDALMQGFLDDGQFSGASLIVRKNGEIVYRNKWGYADYAGTREAAWDDIYRIYSMTKPVTVAAILILSDRGLLSVDDPVSRYIPSFEDMQVVTDERLTANRAAGVNGGDGTDGSGNENLNRVFLSAWQDGSLQTEPFGRQITIRDLLTHSSGLGQDLTACFDRSILPGLGGSLPQVAETWGETPLAFQPGCGTGYSPSAGFDCLARIVEVVSGESFADFIRREIFEPLEMKDTTFVLTGEQKDRLVSITYRPGEELLDYTAVWESEPDIYQARDGYISGSGGLFSTLEDYEHFAWMLCNDGSYKGVSILQPETVARMRAEADQEMINAESPEAWGLGVRIRQIPEALSYHTVSGTYGWSGMAGTHFFVCPSENLDCVLMLNRIDIGGSESPVSHSVEGAVFDVFAG